jgi:hypothetical protein
MKVQCNHKDKCDNPDCMHYDSHKPLIGRYNQVNSKCCYVSDICPIIMAKVICTGDDNAESKRRT